MYAFEREKVCMCEYMCVCAIVDVNQHAYNDYMCSMNDIQDLRIVDDRRDLLSGTEILSFA